MMTRDENVIVYGTAADGIRAWRGLAWRDYNWAGEIVKECKAGSCVPEFGHDHDDEIAATIANMIRPYDCDIYIYDSASYRGEGGLLTGPPARRRPAYPPMIPRMTG